MMTDPRSLVDVERGLVSRRIFIEPEIYEQELAQIFARCWLFLCHESKSLVITDSVDLARHRSSSHKSVNSPANYRRSACR